MKIRMLANANDGYGNEYGAGLIYEVDPRIRKLLDTACEEVPNSDARVNRPVKLKSAEPAENKMVTEATPQTARRGRPRK